MTLRWDKEAGELGQQRECWKRYSGGILWQESNRHWEGAAEEEKKVVEREVIVVEAEEMRSLSKAIVVGRSASAISSLGFATMGGEE